MSWRAQPEEHLTQELYCLVQGDSSIFRVEVLPDCLVSTLRELIYEKCKNSAPGLDAKHLILWKAGFSTSACNTSENRLLCSLFEEFTGRSKPRSIRQK